jgi:hypothetical protein
VDSLQGAKFTTAIGQERDALRYLMEARNTIQMALPKKSKAARAQARAFDRLQRQKLRRQNEMAETLADIAQELNRLADEEDDVAKLLAMGNAAGDGMGKGMADPKAKPMAGMPDPKMPDPKNPDGKGGDPKNPDAKKDGPGKGDPEKPDGDKGMDPTQEKQDDIAGRATVINKAATDAKGLTGLAKTRIAEATRAANAAADALGQKDRGMAKKEVDKARETFRVAAKQVQALAQEEAAQQLAAARDLANDVALKTAPREGADGMGNSDDDKNKKKNQPGMGDGEKGDMMPGLGMAAEQAKSLKDVLEKIAGGGSENSAEAAKRAGELLAGENLQAAIERLEKPGAGGDKAERQDLAERFAALGQKLDQAYRELVAPRLEELAKLEREAADLEKRAGAADDEATAQRARQAAAEFVEKLEEARLGDIANADLKEGLKAGGGPNGRGDTTRLVRGLRSVRESIVAKLQQVVAGDRFATGSEAVPPEYRDLVERYLRALSAGGSK